MRNLVATFGLTFMGAAGSLSLPAAAQDMGLTLSAPVVAAVPQVAQELRPSVSQALPARMLVIGDSLAEGFGVLLITQAEARGMPITVTNAARNSTGLARSDYYDWPAQFEAMVADTAPDIIVAHFGANDMQALIQPGSRTPLSTDDWDVAYAAEIDEVLSTAADIGAVVYLLGPATDTHRNLNIHLARINPLFEDRAAAFGATYFPLVPFTSGPNGEFSQMVEVDGQNVRLRTSDGSHFTEIGYRLVADRVLDSLVAQFPQLDQPSGLASEVASVDDVPGLPLQ